MGIITQQPASAGEGRYRPRPQLPLPALAPYHHRESPSSKAARDSPPPTSSPTRATTHIPDRSLPRPTEPEPPPAPGSAPQGPHSLPQHLRDTPHLPLLHHHEKRQRDRTRRHILTNRKLTGPIPKTLTIKPHQMNHRQILPALDPSNANARITPSRSTPRGNCTTNTNQPRRLPSECFLATYDAIAAVGQRGASSAFAGRGTLQEGVQAALGTSSSSRSRTRRPCVC